MKTLSLKIPDALASRLDAAARKRQSSKSVLVREAIEAYLSDGGRPRSGSFLDLAGDLIASLNGGPGDLAHNQKHLEDYGR
jgi:hypothetical protein